MQISFQKEKRYPEKNIYKNSRTAKENRPTWLLRRENQGDGKTYEKTNVYSVLAQLFLSITAACGANGMKTGEPVKLKNQDGKEVTFPREKPVLFFFITTYT